jgi:arsenite methyltransferase
MAAAPAITKPDYGLDFPLTVRHWLSRGGWSIGIGLFVWFINHQEYPGTSVRIVLALTALGIVFLGVAAAKVWSSREGKLRLRDRLLDQLSLNGDERVLDVGCGRGLMSIGVAKRLKAGKVTAIDVWNPQLLSGNSADAAKANAKAEGVADRIRVEPGDPRKLVYPDNHFDVVTSVGVIHTLQDDHERAQAIREMLRVLKPGGRLLIFDTAETGYYAHLLQDRGAQGVTLSPWSFLWCLPNRSVIAQK